MADSFVRHVASGSTDTFSIPFGYLDSTHISVKVDGVTEAFTFPSASQVQITSGNPSASAVVEVRRTTPRDGQEVVWSNAANLTASDLNTADLQFLYITQEAFDEADEALKKDASGIFDAESIRIQNVATPTSGGDAANKTYADAAAAAVSVDAAAAAASAASSAADVLLTNADVVLTNADVVSTNADVVTSAANAAAAASSAAEGLYNAVITITNADSPYVPSLAQEGTLFRCDTSSGSIIINLSELAATYGEDVKFAFVKSTGDANTITINRGGSDTIDGGTSEVLSNQYVITVLVGDSASNSWISAVQASGVSDGAITEAKLADNAVTLDKMAGGIDGNLLSFDASGDPAYVATGTAGQMLTSNGAGAAPTFQDAAGGGMGVLLGSYTASSDTSVDIGDGLDLDVALDTTYDEYELHIFGADPVTDGAVAWLRDSSDTGSSFGTSGYEYQGIIVDSAGSSTIGSGSGSALVMSSSNGVDNSFGGFNAIIRFIPVLATRSIYMIETNTHSNDAGFRWERGFVGGQRAASIDALRFMFSTGNIVSGTFRLYGIAKS